MKKVLLFLLIVLIISACGQLQQNKNETSLEKQEGIINGGVRC
ncbi:hypothetical protein [Virgibacillus profundi]|nr:hypothetical protein [Virgibacillus profundi]